MTNKKSILGMLVLMLTFGALLSSCATNVASLKSPNWDKKPIGTESHDYTLLGTVKLEKNWFGVLGLAIDRIGDFFIYQSGGVTYADLLDEARKEYPDADAVVDVKIDYAGSFYAIFYAQRKNIVTGIAIKYVKEPRPAGSSQSIDVRLK
jgi:hypothetical protein